jgi:hypothetical protein
MKGMGRVHLGFSFYIHLYLECNERYSIMLRLSNSCDNRVISFRDWWLRSSLCYNASIFRVNRMGQIRRWPVKVPQVEPSPRDDVLLFATKHRGVRE